MAIWSARRSASSRYCVVRKTVVPLSASSSMVCHMSLRPLGSSPVVGSSRKRTGASPTRLMAMSRRRRIPPEKVSRRRSAASFRSNVSSSSVAVCFWVGDVAQLAHQHQVLPGGEHVVHRGELPGQGDLLADLGGLRRHVEPGDARRPPVGPDQGRQDVDRGRLAGAVGSEQSEDRAPFDAERDVVEHRHSLVSLLEVLHLDGVGCSVHGSLLSPCHGHERVIRTSPKAVRARTWTVSADCSGFVGRARVLWTRPNWCWRRSRPPCPS